MLKPCVQPLHGNSLCLRCSDYTKNLDLYVIAAGNIKSHCCVFGKQNRKEEGENDVGILRKERPENSEITPRLNPEDGIETAPGETGLIDQCVQLCSNIEYGTAV